MNRKVKNEIDPNFDAFKARSVPGTLHICAAASLTEQNSSELRVSPYKEGISSECREVCVRSSCLTHQKVHPSFSVNVRKKIKPSLRESHLLFRWRKLQCGGKKKQKSETNNHRSPTRKRKEGRKEEAGAGEMTLQLRAPLLLQRTSVWLPAPIWAVHNCL